MVNMGKITKKLILYFILIISLVVVICFIGSSVFLSKFYLKQQYSELKNTAEEIYNALQSGSNYTSINVKAVLIKEGKIYPLSRGNMMGMMRLFKNRDPYSLQTEGKTSVDNNEVFLYYNLSTSLGNIITFQNYTSSTEYLKVVYIILIAVFLTAVLLSVPLISYVGKKFTEPILKLKNSSAAIAKGNFNVSLVLNTNDEIEDLSKSIENMALSLARKYSLQKDFIANVSHDFKTPLSIIRSYSEAINDGLVKEDGIKEYSLQIIEEVDRLNALVTDLLQLSKLKDDGIKLNRVDINLDQFIKRCIYNFKDIASKKAVTLKYGSTISVNVSADENYLRRVIYNFLDNGVKFTKANGVVEVTSQYITDEKGNKNIKLSVIDNGEGMDEYVLKDIWNRYFKNIKSGGMGLGLPICSEILRLHHFQYGVESQIGKGSTFYFIIPSKYISSL